MAAVSPYLDAEVAATYDELAVPLQFAAPAQDLVASVALPVGSRVLDVGTGTGAVLTRVAAAVGLSGVAIGVDLSVPMLTQLTTKRACLVAAARIPKLPFPDDVFDGVLASFVLPHCQDYEAALEEMKRVMRSGGRIGVTTWAIAPNAAAQLWNDIVGTFMSLDDLKREFARFIPWDEKFTNEDDLRRALAGASFTNVGVVRRAYPTTMTAGDYQRLKAAGVEGMLVRRRLGSAPWQNLARQLSDAFQSQFADGVEYERSAYVAVATKS